MLSRCWVPSRTKQASSSLLRNGEKDPISSFADLHTSEDCPESRQQGNHTERGRLDRRNNDCGCSLRPWAAGHFALKVGPNMDRAEHAKVGVNPCPVCLGPLLVFGFEMRTTPSCSRGACMCVHRALCLRRLDRLC